MKVEALKAALVQADLDYQELGEKYGDLLEQKRCDCDCPCLSSPVR